MSIDLLAEKTLSVKAAARFAARLLGEDEPTMHIATIYRWISPGIQGVCLEHARIGGRMVTSQEAIQRFSDALTQAKQVEVPISIPKVRRAVPQDIARRNEVALARLRAKGLNV